MQKLFLLFMIIHSFQRSIASQINAVALEPMNVFGTMCISYQKKDAWIHYASKHPRFRKINENAFKDCKIIETFQITANRNQEEMILIIEFEIPYDKLDNVYKAMVNQKHQKTLQNFRIDMHAQPA